MKRIIRKFFKNTGLSSHNVLHTLSRVSENSRQSVLWMQWHLEPCHANVISQEHGKNRKWN